MLRKVRFSPVFMIPISALAFILLLFGAYSAVVEAGNSVSVSVYSKHLIIDAGHGGFDGGAIGVNGVLEKEINLKIAKKTASLARLAGFSVIMARESDTGTNDSSADTIREKKVSDMHNRLALTKEYPDGIYLSIHQNTFPDASCRGGQVFYSTNNEMSKIIASNLQNKIKESLQPDNKREIKPAQKNLYLLYNSEIPTVLLECGFLSNEVECKMLCDSGYQQDISFCAVASLMESINQT